MKEIFALIIAFVMVFGLSGMALFRRRARRLPINAVLAVLVFVAMYSMAKHATATMIYDDFNDGSINLSKWEVDLGPDITATETGGRLELSILPLASGVDFGGGVNSTLLFTGDFDLQVDFLLESWPSQNGVRSALGIWSSTADAGVFIERSASSPAGNFPERYNMNGDAGIRGVTLTSDQDGKLRLQRIENVITGYSFDTIVGWQAIASYTNQELGIVSSDPLGFGLNVWSHDSYFPGGEPVFNPGGQPVTVAFDNITLSTVPEPIPEPATIALLGIGLVGIAGVAVRRRLKKTKQ